MEVNAADTRDVRNPRFSPDGKALLFDVCDVRFPERCRIHLYFLESGKLGYYQPLPGQTWLQASFSGQGKEVVFVTSPIGDRKRSLYEQRNELLRNHQIAIMNLDGSDVRVLTKNPGYKGLPSFSRLGDKIIYAMAEQIRDTGKTLASLWDLWEIDLKTNETHLFTRKKFGFYQLGGAVYFADGQRVLVNGGPPMLSDNGSLTSSDYSERYNNSSVLVLKRGQLLLEPPLYSDVSWARNACIDGKGAIYFLGTTTKEGTKVHRVRPDGKLELWSYPPVSKSSTLWDATVSPDGSNFVVNITPNMEHPKSKKLLLLETNNGKWRELPLHLQPTLINPHQQNQKKDKL